MDDSLDKRVAALEKITNEILRRQEQMLKMLAENNILLRRNIELFHSSKPKQAKIEKQVFPIETEQELEMVERNCYGEERDYLVAVMENLLGGEMKRLEHILGKNIILNYNYDGIKGKKSLKALTGFIDALFEATMKEDRSKEEFEYRLRGQIRKLKNRVHKQNWREGKKVDV